MNNSFKYILLILSFSVSFAECRQGIISIFKSPEIKNLTNHLVGSQKSTVGKECSEKLGFEATSESYCDCIDKNPNTNYSVSRKKFRAIFGREFKGSVFRMISSLKQFDNYYPNQQFQLDCNLNGIIKKNCSDSLVDEMLPEYKGKNLAYELFIDHSELYNHASNNTMNLFKTKSCASPLIKMSDYVFEKVEDPQTALVSMCSEFSNEVSNFCNNESLTEMAKEEFEFDHITNPDVADNYNYYCKLKDKPVREQSSSNVLDILKEEYERANRLDETPAICKKVCEDNAPYSIYGCKLNEENAKKELRTLSCKNKTTVENQDACNFLVEVIGNDIYYKIKEGSFKEEDLEYLKENLSDEDYEKVLQISRYNQVRADVEKVNSVTEQFISGDIETKEMAHQTPSQSDNESLDSSQAVSQNTSQTSQPQQQAQVQDQQIAQQGPVQQSNLNTNNSGRLTMGSRGRGRRKVSARTKQMVETIKTLREAGSSLKDAIAAQDRRMKKEREELARANREKYQRYDAETLEPIRRSPSSDDRRRSNDRQIANVGSPTSGSGGSNGMSSGAGGSGGTGNSTFLPPEKKATVVDITGRSAPELDLNNLQSSGATLPASITNHPDASEISKMFNGLEYKKDSGRGPASKDDEIKKIKVDWSAKSIDLGSLLINAKDIKPGEEFILYKGDMDQYVRLVPSYTFRRGKKVFIGYRIDNRSSENADLASSIFAKKFLIL
ncbi:hypothetical protein [Halobacteriovorax sp.]|uniref:hypothetical protein n=1 Tax=Halobacteriovorax sp. TaxID=2020862 RepID=UPI003AF24097